LAYALVAASCPALAFCKAKPVRELTVALLEVVGQVLIVLAVAGELAEIGGV